MTVAYRVLMEYVRYNRMQMPRYSWAMRKGMHHAEPGNRSGPVPGHEYRG